MRIARKLTLLAMLALAVTALAAPSAFAQVEPLAHNQTPQIIVQSEVHGATDVNCPAVTPSPPPVPSPLVTAGGCRAHVSGTAIELWAHLSAGGPEILVSNCNVEFDIRIDAAGEGYISHQEFTQPPAGSGCTRRACGQVTPPTSEGRAYSFFLREIEPAPTERGTVLFCTEAMDGTGATHCEVTLPVAEPAPHAYRFTATDLSGHGALFPHCELGGGGPSGGAPAIFDTEAALQTTGEGQAEQRLEIRHQ